MTTTANPSPLLDGPGRNIFLGVIFLVLSLITIDGVLTGLAANEADDAIGALVDANPDRYPTGVDDEGQLLSDGDAAVIAEATDGNRLDRDLITTKTVLAAIGLVAAIALTLAAGPGGSRNVLAATIVVAGIAFFVPLYFYSDTIDIVTTAHGG